MLEDNGNRFHLHTSDTVQGTDFTSDQDILVHALFQNCIVRYAERFVTPLLVFS
jgi:hypothetical protein